MRKSQCHLLLETLCPMHVVFDEMGKIRNAGPTVQKIFDSGLIGRRFLDVFEIKRPKEIATIEALRERTGVKLNLGLRDLPGQQLKGVVVAGPEDGQMTANLSFGISIVDAVRDFDLTAADFAPTDLTVEMLYLVEAKSAAMDASHQLNQRLQVARVEAEQQALTDTLTGLQNRRAMDQELLRATALAKPFALMHLDLDYFKTVNDTLGHAAGDHVLQHVARVLSDATRETDMVARMGGDEFVIFVPGLVGHAELDKMALRIIARLQQPIPFEDDLCTISASVGTVIVTADDHATADQLLIDADAALYAAKKAGRGQHVIFTPVLRQQSNIA